MSTKVTTIERTYDTEGRCVKETVTETFGNDPDIGGLGL